MNKALTGALISLGLLVPFFASATFSPKPQKDTTPPVIAAHADVKVSVNGVLGATVTYTKPTATDKVSGSVAVTCTPPSGTFFTLGMTTVTCTAQDAAGNKAAPRTFKVHVDDSTRPVIVVTNIASNGTNPAKAQAGDTITLSFTTSEPVFPPVVIVNSRTLFMRSTGSESTWQASYTVQAKDPVGKVIYLITAIDKAKNLTACSSIPLPIVSDCAPTNGSSVTIVKATPPDTTPPVIGAHGNVSAEATSADGATVTYTNPTALDNSGNAVSVSCAPASGSTFALGTTGIICTAQDSAGNNAAPTNFSVIVVDTTAPVIAAHESVVAEATSASGAPVMYTPPVSTDLVDGAAPAVCTLASGTTFSLGVTTVTCTAHDAAGNTAVPTSFTVEVRDTTAPSVAAHADVFAATPGSSASVSYDTPAATDNVDASVAVSCAPASGSFFSLGTTTVTCTAHDSAGNTAASTFAVGVTQELPPQDTEAPIIAPHADVHATADGTSAIVEYELPTATDNVDASVTVSCAPASGSAFNLGSNTVTCTAHDVAGNPAQSSFLVIVEEEEVVLPALYEMDSQSDQSFLCGEAIRNWGLCDEEGTFSFSDGFSFGEMVATIDIGLGSGMDTGILQTVTIAKDAQDANEAENNFNHPWDITISCFTDSSHGTPCPDWAAITDDANESSDGKYWTADFSLLNRTFRQDGHYVMTISDTGVPAAVFGSESKQEPYWKIVGLK